MRPACSAERLAGSRSPARAGLFAAYQPAFAESTVGTSCCLGISSRLPYHDSRPRSGALAILDKIRLERLICVKAMPLQPDHLIKGQSVEAIWEMTDAARNSTGIPEIGKFTVPAYSILVLSAIGIAVALYVAHGSYTGQTLWCPIIDGCNAVVNSPYSRVFGVPMSYFGFIYYLYMFALAIRLAFEPFSKSLRFRVILYSAMGAISSAYFMYLQLRFIREMCTYCLISAVASLLLLLAALWHFQTTRHPALKAAN
jgi:uncharacterized membrane protein